MLEGLRFLLSVGAPSVYSLVAKGTIFFGENQRKEPAYMSVARVLELSAVSPDSFEAAIREAVDRATRTLRGVQSAWVKDMNVLLENDAISGFQVNLAFTFVLEEGESIAEFEGTTGTASEIPEFEGTRGTASDEDIRRGTPADSVT